MSRAKRVKQARRDRYREERDDARRRGLSRRDAKRLAKRVVDRAL